MLKWLGCLVLVGALWVINKRYRDYHVTIDDEYGAFLDFLGELCRNMDCYMLSIGGWIDTYENSVLEDCGFLSDVRSGAMPSCAFQSARAKLSLPANAMQIMEEYFNSFGKGYIDAELKTLERCISELQELKEKDVTDGKKTEQVMGAICVSVALGLAIALL